MSTRARKRLLLLAAVVLCVLGGMLLYETPLRVAAREALAKSRLSRHAQVLLAASNESGVDVHLLAAISLAESSGRVNVVSSKGALGLFQLSEVTAAWRAERLGLEPPTREALLSDPLLNARLGADTMAWLLDTYDGDEVRALCAYNAGTRKMKNLADAAGGWEAWLAKSEASGRSEILAYAKKVLRLRNEYRVAAGLAPIPIPVGRPAP